MGGNNNARNSDPSTRNLDFLNGQCGVITEAEFRIPGWRNFLAAAANENYGDKDEEDHERHQGLDDQGCGTTPEFGMQTDWGGQMMISTFGLSFSIACC